VNFSVFCGQSDAGAFVRFFIEKTGHSFSSVQVRFRMKTTDFIGDLVSRFAKGGVFTTSTFKGEVKSLDAVRKVLRRMADAGV